MSIKCSSFRCRALQNAGDMIAVQRSRNVDEIFAWESEPSLKFVEEVIVCLEVVSTKCSLGERVLFEVCRGGNALCSNEETRAELSRIYCDSWITPKIDYDEFFDAIFPDVRRDLRTDGCDLDGQATPSSPATCKGYPLALKCLLIAFGSKQRSRCKWRPFASCSFLPTLSTSLHSKPSQVPNFQLLFTFKLSDFKAFCGISSSITLPSTRLSSLSLPQNRTKMLAEHSNECASIHVNAPSILPSREERLCRPNIPARMIIAPSIRLLGIIVAHKCVMAEEQAPASTSNVDGEEYDWVADEPRTTVSRFSLHGGDGMFRTIQRPPVDDWKACIPSPNRRICSKFQWGSFPMYQIAFEHMGYRLPFSDFEVAVFRYLHLTPSQLHPNSLAFIRAFEMTAAYLGFLPTIPLFFHAFHLQRSRPKGNAANKFGWVSLKQSVKLFEMFLESVRGFKDSYFFIKPLNSVSWQSIIYRGPAKDATGAPLIGPDGRPVLEDYSRFPLSWRKSHYLKPASDFIYSSEELTVEELSNYEQMKVFVGSFPPKTYEDENGNIVLDESGAPLTKNVLVCI
ncbi:hypothetical protein TSUD_247030 [Trifolium subterraneum]|uniref:Transposase (putative) gypsy type domain-containing protein n=1 Tax=Trifolium subterraneum TaxID=3900 RepID=A0A2Z6P3X9_TRISU|nr:hypothetical protein TSUD_247030 [Trifolium subterraneum]